MCRREQEATLPPGPRRGLGVTPSRARRDRWAGVWGAVAAIWVVGALPVAPEAEAQASNADGEAAAADAKPVPFGPGELKLYEAKLGPVPVGEGRLEVHGIEEVRDQETYHLSLSLEGGIPLARVDDQQTSWLDVRELMTHRFIQDLHQVRYERYREYEIFPEDRYFDISDREEPEEMITDQPLDEIAFLYYVRSLPLEVGDKYELNRYFQEDGNPVLLKVVREEEVETPAGTFETVVVRPTIETSGIFSEGGEAEVYFSNDDRRLLVKLHSRVPALPGSLSLLLEEVREGDPLQEWTPDMRHEAAERYRNNAGGGSP